MLIGREHRAYPDGPYRICLTANQRKVLFKNKPPKLIKCGTFGCAFEAPDAPGKVIKLTRDETDVGAMIEARGTDLVPDLYDVRELKQKGRSVKTGQGRAIYALELERLEPVPPWAHAPLNDRREKMRDAISEVIDPSDACRIDDDAVRQICLDVVEAGWKLNQMGIEWFDTHSGNYGYDRFGRLKILDVGLSSMEPPPGLPVLERPLTPRRRRRYVRRAAHI